MLRIGNSPARAVTIAAAGFLVMTGMGAAPTGSACDPSHPAASDAKAWLDAKTVCLFRLGNGPMPQGPDELSAALAAGCEKSIALPDAAKLVTIEGAAAFPALSSLRIDLSDGRFRSPKSKDKIKVNNKVERELSVEHLEVRGEPLLLYKARLNMSLSATAARIEMERDRRGRPVMMLSDARAGTFTFDVTRADAEGLLLRQARDAASKYGVTVEKTLLSIVPETPRSLQASLYIATKVGGVVPAGMLFRCHVTVDDAMNAKITGLTCDGDEALGPLIVTLLRPAIANYNGKTRPLLSFPAGTVHLRDVAVRVDTSLHLTAAFGS